MYKLPIMEGYNNLSNEELESKLIENLDLINIIENDNECIKEILSFRSYGVNIGDYFEVSSETHGFSFPLEFGDVFYIKNIVLQSKFAYITCESKKHGTCYDLIALDRIMMYAKKVVNS